jgi:serine/threonine-protein kinase
VTPERWRQINDVFHAALAQDAAERERFVRKVAAGDEELEREVFSLIRSHEQSGDQLEKRAWEGTAELLALPEPLGAGQAIGKYRIVRELARGGMGIVYRSTDEVLGRPVALKALPAEYAKDRNRRERLVREAQLMAQLNHRAIATVYELVESEDALYIATEFVPGITLRQELHDGPLPPAHLLGTLLEIAAALAAAHAHNIIHRDLKPENIIRRDDGQIKVLDFGLARLGVTPDIATRSRLTEAGIVAGTPGYMAPEVLNSVPADERSDIFVFGLMGWELATGRHPLGSNPHSQMARLHDITAGAEPVLSGTMPVPGLEGVLRRCTRRLPEERYQSAEALLHDLRSLQLGELRSPQLREPTGATGTGAVAAATPGLWWWRFHQRTMAAVVASAPIWSWLVRADIGRPSGTWTFFTVFALAVASVTLRLNLVFISRVHPDILRDQHARLSRWLPWTEGSLSLLLLWSAALISGTREATAALLIGLAIVIAASLAVIEPNTSRGAGLGSPPGQPRPTGGG